jgi:RNA polymerase sigma-70 factor (ECF subfamily)
VTQSNTEVATRTLGNFATLAVNYPVVITTADAERLSDDDLVRRAVAGERDAVLMIYQRHHGGIYRFARAMTGSTTAAEDVTQEVFLFLLQKLDRFDAARGSLGTFLYAVARNMSRHRLRKERRFVALDDPAGRESPPGDDPVSAMMASETVTRVRRLILTLSSRYREVLILCDLQGVTYEEASRILSTPIGTVRSRLHRARAQLGERLAQPHGRAASLGQGKRHA